MLKNHHKSTVLFNKAHLFIKFMFCSDTSYGIVIDIFIYIRNICIWLQLLKLTHLYPDASCDNVAQIWETDACLFFPILIDSTSIHLIKQFCTCNLHSIQIILTLYQTVSKSSLEISAHVTASSCVAIPCVWYFSYWMAIWNILKWYFNHNFQIQMIN